MKFFSMVVLFLSLSLVAKAENSDAIKNAVESPPDSYDGNELYNPPEGGKQMRAPTSSDLPYSDDEIQHNSPENYKTKNMPIDQD